MTRAILVPAAPGRRARRTGAVGARRPLTGVHTVLPLLAVRADAGGARWPHVRLPGRPSGHTGWISAGATRRTSTPWAIVVHLGVRQVTVFDQGRAVRRFTATVGKPSTPTPRGDFFVEESSAPASGAAGLSGGLGAAVAHGCVRLGPRAITWLAHRVGAGVPPRIEA